MKSQIPRRLRTYFQYYRDTVRRCMSKEAGKEDQDSGEENVNMPMWRKG